jgi:quinol monooxygenase YgiN
MRRVGILLALVAGYCLGHVAVAQEEHPIVAQVKPKLKDPTKPFVIGVRAKVKAGMGEKLEAAFAPAIKESRKEKGCQAYLLNRSADDETVYVMFERWENLAALEAHLKQPYITKALGDIHELLEGAPDVRVFVPVAE